MKFNPDVNSGSPQGIAELIENRRDGGFRQIASNIYPLDGVEVMKETLVARILFDIADDGETKKASGVQLADGREFVASKEVILSAGTYRTPQVLLLSGIGPAEDLATHGIKQVVDAPEVGRNLHDHLNVAQWWKLREIGAGLALGDPKFNNPAFLKGYPTEWVVTQTVPHEGLTAAWATDEGIASDQLDAALHPSRSHTESLISYVAMNPANPTVPMDGSHVTSVVVGLLPTSRGSVTLASTDPNAAPVIDPNYYATEADRYVIRTALRRMMEAILDTKDGQAMVDSGVYADGKKALTSKATDEELDGLVAERGT